jgi:catechol 2,3-dioxygenase-like lactoylglutathione lyase family enzyme
MEGEVSLLSGVLEVAIYVDDLDAAESFYGGLLGLPVVVRKEGAHIFFRCGEAIVLAFRPDVTRAQAGEGPLPVPPHGADGAGHVAFSISGGDIDKLTGILTDNGIAIEADFNWPNGARSVYVRDPGGNSVEFAEARLWEEGVG